MLQFPNPKNIGSLASILIFKKSVKERTRSQKLFEGKNSLLQEIEAFKEQKQVFEGGNNRNVKKVRKFQAPKAIRIRNS